MGRILENIFLKKHVKEQTSRRMKTSMISLITTQTKSLIAKKKECVNTPICYI